MTFRDFQIRSGLAGLGLFLICAGIGWFYPTAFFHEYLLAFIFWVSITLGCLGLLLLQFLTGGLWGLVIKRILEAGMLTLPLSALLFMPVLAGAPYLFPWIHPLGPEMVLLVHKKSLYLNLPFYIIRNIGYFAILDVLAFWVRELSLRRDGGQTEALATLGKVSGPALIVFVLLMNFASTDWIMSLSPKWYSSMLVVEFCSEQTVVAMAVAILALRCLANVKPLRDVLNEKVVHDCGKLLLAFTCFWTYVTFSEYLIIWTGNLPHEISWFLDRSSMGWKAWAVLLVLLHFVFPIFSLIITAISKNLNRLSIVAGMMIGAHFVQTVWWIEPAFGHGFHPNPLGPLLILALGGIWLASFTQALGSASLLPLELRQAERKEVPA